MKIHPYTWILSICLLLMTIVCLNAADLAPTPAAGGTGAGITATPKIAFAIPVIIPAVLAALKSIWPSVPKVMLPSLCPVIGAVMSLVLAMAGQSVDPATGAALGAVGNWLRELYDQTKKATVPVAVWVLALLALATGQARAAHELAYNPDSGRYEWQSRKDAPCDQARCRLCGNTSAAEVKADPFERFSLSPFVSYRVHEFASHNGKFGGGLAAGFAVTRSLTLEAEAIGERFDDSHWLESLTEAGANLKLSTRPGKPINPYGLLGYTRNLDIDENRMNAGAGVEFNLHRNLAAFADGRWTHDFDHIGHALFRAGLSVKF